MLTETGSRTAIATFVIRSLSSFTPENIIDYVCKREEIGLGPQDDLI